MKYLNPTGIVAALAFAGLVPACATPSAGAAAESPTANPTSATSDSTSPAPATQGAGLTPAAGDTDNGNAAPAADASAAAPGNTGAGAPAGGSSAEAAGPAAPGSASGAITGQVTASPAKYGKHVVVWLNSGGLPAKPKSVGIDQRSMKFLPYLAAVPAGGRVVFRNSDPFPHNVMSPDKAAFNLGMMPAKSARSHVFKEVGPHTILCQIHPGMIAYIYVVPSKYYAVADPTGHFTIKNVPNGTYKLSAWGPKLATSTETVKVSGASATVALHLHRGG